MLQRRFYYNVKPFLPRRLRVALRRFLAIRKEKTSESVWPILEAAARPPLGWNGWPEGKRFALVLTHDVEGSDGLANCRRLAEREEELGFHSCFYFIPEGSYASPTELCSWLTSRGFEVGVHDLHHDGNLYRSREAFTQNAKRINYHLKKLGGVGFRSGFMLHKLDWLHELEIEYDCSTFDTDPFEPQPDGVGTIFPFWIPDEGASSPGKGYVELPYSLPQDSTLFLILRKDSPEIWMRKLDWIVKNGGMALVDVHPDYLQFPSEPADPRKYPVSHYLKLLEYVRDKYADSFWQPLPREMARFVKSFRPLRDPAAPAHPRAASPGAGSQGPAGTGEAPCRPRRILMLVENNYPSDTRVYNEASLLVANGYQVSVIALRKPGQPFFETIGGVRVCRLPRVELFKKTPAETLGPLGRIWLKAKAFLGYTLEYAYFTSGCFCMSCYVLFRYGFDAIHAHNPPDTLFLVAIPFKLLGKRFVFDHHDLCPELYRSRYSTGENLTTRLLRAAEWGTFRTANLTIATNESYRSVHIARGGRDPRTIFVVRNGPNALRMTAAEPTPRLRGMGKCILVYIGSLNPQDGVDYLLRALGRLRGDLRRDDFHCVIMGSGDSLDDLRQLTKSLGLDGHVELTGFVPDSELQSNLAAADICLDPDPSSPLNDVSTWIKIMEYMACAKPIVSFDLKETRYSAQGAAVYVPPNDELEFARAVLQLMDDPGRRASMGEFGRRRVVEHLQWSVVGRNLLAAYEHLLGPPSATASAQAVEA